MIVLEGLNPFGNLAATVEDDGRTVYLYVHHVDRRDWGFRALWVRNRIAAPEGEDEEARAAHVAPRMPKGLVAHPEGAPPLQADRLSLLWLEEGDGVALLEDDVVLALSPPWAGDDGTAGNARDAKGRWRYAAPLEDAERIRLRSRLERAASTWNRWRHASTWTDERMRGLSHLEAALGSHDQYFAADGGKFPPLAIARFSPKPGIRVFSTIGMGAFPMPQVEREGRAHPRRIELAVASRGEPSWAPQVLAWLGRYPWVFYTWLGDGHVICSPVGQASWFPPDRSAILLVASDAVAGDADVPRLAPRRDQNDEEVTYLWALPITMDEKRSAEIEGVATLRERLARIGRVIAPMD